MKSLIMILLLILQISYSQHSVCLSNDPPTLVRISELKIKSNDAYQFKIYNYASPAIILRNINGTFITGNFSTVTLLGQNKAYEYVSTGLSFKYPPQHRIVQLNDQMIEMQITYQLVGKSGIAWRHRRMAMSVIFVLTEYASEEKCILGKQIHQQLTNGTILNLQQLLPLVPNLTMILYKGYHTEQPSDGNFLWLVRKQLLLMREEEFEGLKSFIYQHRARQQIDYHGLLSRVSDLNEISEAEVFPQKTVSSQF